MVPGLRSPLPDAVVKFAGVDRHVRAVAVEGDAYTKGCDVGPARLAHRDLGRSRHDLRAREASSRAFGGEGTQGARSDIDGTLNPVFETLTVTRPRAARICGANDTRGVCMSLRKRLSHENSDAGGARAFVLDGWPLLVIWLYREYTPPPKKRWNSPQRTTFRHRGPVPDPSEGGRTPAPRTKKGVPTIRA